VLLEQVVKKLQRVCVCGRALELEVRAAALVATSRRWHLEGLDAESSNGEDVEIATFLPVDRP
jgi:hypothetical protein